MVIENTNFSYNQTRLSNAKKLSCNTSDLESALSCKGSIYQIKQKSHEELDIEIQSSRILYVLDELINKLEIAAKLPKLIENNGQLLRKYVVRKDADFILDACLQYVEQDDDESMEKASLCSSSMIEEKEKPKKDIKDIKTDFLIQQAVAMLCDNEELKKKLFEAEEDLEVDDLSWMLIEGAKRLRQAAAQKLAVSANEERERERELRKAWKENAEAKSTIESIQDKLNKQKDELDIQLNAKDELINSYKARIEAMKTKFKEDIKKKILDSEKSMIQKTQISEEKQALLQQESKEVVHNYWTLLEQHLANEKTLRAKRFKIEAQLASWLAKYDQDIGERQEELEELQRLYQEELNELNALQKQFDEQEEDYIELMAERDDYERKIYEERAYIFLMNRSARKIQRMWRAYRERRRLRKKARRSKKKEKGSASGEGESGGDSGKKSSAGEKGNGKGKGKKGKKEKGKGKEKAKILHMDEDPMAKLESKFKGHILEDISTDPMPTSAPVHL